MKTLLPLFLAAVPFVSFPQDTRPGPRLMGIIEVENLKLAVLEDMSPPSQTGREILLEEGQRDGGIELVEIHSAKGTVTAKVAGESDDRVLGFTNQNHFADGSFGSLVLEDVGIQTVLQLFGEFSGRTLLQHPGLPALKFTITSSVTNRTAAAQVLQSALVEKQIAVVLDGEKFALIAPKAQASTLKPRSSQIQAASLKPSGAELIPKGSVVFMGARTAQVLGIYVELRGDKLDRDAPLPPKVLDLVYLRMGTALSKEELLYALETLIGWNGIKVVPSGNGLVKAVSALPE